MPDFGLWVAGSLGCRVSGFGWPEFKFGGPNFLESKRNFGVRTGVSTDEPSRMGSKRRVSVSPSHSHERLANIEASGRVPSRHSPSDSISKLRWLDADCFGQLLATKITSRVDHSSSCKEFVCLFSCEELVL